jgi:hypothetical protein
MDLRPERSVGSHIAQYLFHDQVCKLHRDAPSPRSMMTQSLDSAGSLGRQQVPTLSA